jgi:hypothetical protein
MARMLFPLLIERFFIFDFPYCVDLIDISGFRGRKKQRITAIGNSEVTAVISAVNSDER